MRGHHNLQSHFISSCFWLDPRVGSIMPAGANSKKQRYWEDEYSTTLTDSWQGCVAMQLAGVKESILETIILSVEGQHEACSQKNVQNFRYHWTNVFS